jgi:hypothetical protein
MSWLAAVRNWPSGKRLEIASIGKAPRQAARVGPAAALWLAAICAAILFSRKPCQFLNPQFHMEDGTEYFQTILDGHGFASVFMPHSGGQLFTLQRLFAWLLSPLPVRWMPHAYFAVALLGTLAACLYVFRSRVDSRFRWLMALAVVSVYVGWGRVFLHLLNLHWILALVLITMLISPEPRSRAGRIAETIAAFLLGVTGPFGLLLCPLFIARALWQRTPHAVWLMAATMFAAGCQLATIEPTRRGGAVDLSDPHWGRFLGRHMAGSLFFGDWCDRIPIAETWFQVLGIVLAWHLVRYIVRSRDWQVAGLVCVGTLIFAAAAWSWRAWPEEVDHPGYRYHFIPTVCLAWSLLLIAERSREYRPKAIVALAFMALAAATAWRLRPLPDRNWAEASKCIGGPVPCRIPIDPDPMYVAYMPRPK